MNTLKTLGKAFIKILVFSLITAVFFWMINATMKGIAIGSYKEGIKAGYKACQQRTGVLLDTRGREVEDWTLRHRNEPQ